MILKKVKNFYKKLLNDGDFRARLDKAGTACERRKTAREAGYDFTQEELATATVQILEQDELRKPGGILNGLTADHLELAFGGKLDLGTIQPMYGVVAPGFPPINDPTQPVSPSRSRKFPPFRRPAKKKT
ncbi:MAG: Nif11-like leader peptide family natural product precursor [Proteobacteria bacterium]|nr:Nif11-like leader peptide family natural product precursor [Pseudomonadota bacterium]